MINCLFEFASVSIDLDDSTYLKGALYHLFWILTHKSNGHIMYHSFPCCFCN